MMERGSLFLTSFRL